MILAAEVQPLGSCPQPTGSPPFLAREVYMKLGRLASLALVLLGLALWLHQYKDASTAPVPDPMSPLPGRLLERDRGTPSSEALTEHVPRAFSSVHPMTKGISALQPPFARILSRTLSERRALYDAEETAVATCMAERGFEYKPNQYIDDAEQKALFPRYQVGNVDVASAIGYGIAEKAEVGEIAVQTDANAMRLQDMPPVRRDSWLTALRGKDRPPPDLTGGKSDPDVGVVSIPLGPSVSWDRNSCLTKAQRALYGSDDEYMRATLETNMAVNEVNRLIDADPDYRLGVERWQQCMSQRGYSYPHPGAAAVDLGREFREGAITLEQLRAKEITIAIADAECFVRAGLIDLHGIVQSRVELDVAAKYEDTLTAYEQMMNRALQKAQPRLGAGNQVM